MKLQTTTMDEAVVRIEIDADVQIPASELPEDRLTTTSQEDVRLDDPRTSTNTLPETISATWLKIAKAEMSIAMYDDLVRIAMLPDKWRGTGTRALDSQSLGDFLKFWLIVRDVAVEPELALAPDGSLHAEWYNSQRKRLDIRFGKRKSFFGLFSNNTILEGADDMSTVAQILKYHSSEPLKWHPE